MGMCGTSYLSNLHLATRALQGHPGPHGGSWRCFLLFQLKNKIKSSWLTIGKILGRKTGIGRPVWSLYRASLPLGVLTCNFGPRYEFILLTFVHYYRNCNIISWLCAKLSIVLSIVYHYQCIFIFLGFFPPVVC
jgi:hypothetical protein